MARIDSTADEAETALAQNDSILAKNDLPGVPFNAYREFAKPAAVSHISNKIGQEKEDYYDELFYQS